MRISDWSSDVCSSDLLHLADVEQLLGLLDRLVDAGKSVIVIEHHQAVMAHADWIIDLGPGAGHDGGQVVFEGTPAALVSGRPSLTGDHLARSQQRRVGQEGVSTGRSRWELDQFKNKKDNDPQYNHN